MSPAREPSAQELRDLYRAMLRIRLIEEEIAARYGEQEMRCPVHLSVGQEAAAVGACAPLRPTDQITSSHRCHGHYLAKGGDLRAMLAEIYGKAAGCCGGRGGSMHLFDAAAGVLASVPIVASAVPLAVGAALAFQQRAEDGVAVAFLGDGSLEEGVTHESLNFAARFHLPVVFFVENNFFSVYTPLDQRQPVRPLAAIAGAHGMPALEADGNDVLAVLKATEEAVAAARAGAGPTLIVAETYRWREHCGPNYDNDLGYRAEDEFLAWKARDPVATFAVRLSESGAMTGTDSDAMAGAIGAEIDAAFGFAKAAPFPDGATAAERVYA